MFGDDFFKNAMICFSRFGQDKRSKREREKGNKASADKLRRDYKSKFAEIYGINLLDSQFSFIDNNIDEDCEDEERRCFQASLLSIKAFTNQMQPFFCHDIKEVMKENDELKAQLQNLHL